MAWFRITEKSNTVKLNETIFDGNINYAHYSGASTSDTFNIGKFHEDAKTLIIEAKIEGEYASVWTRYILKKGVGQYGYLVSDRYTDASHRIVALLISRASDGTIKAQPWRCNDSGSRRTIVKIVGTSEVDFNLGNE